MVSIVSLDPPLVGIRLKERQTSVYIRDIYKGLGTLYITEDNITWVNDNNEGFLLKYPDISIFAVCTDLEKYAECCIYILVRDEDTTENDSHDDEEFSEELEIRFAPSKGANVHDLFNCIQECNRLHPSSDNDSFAGDGSGDEGESDLGDTCYEANEQENAYLFKNGNIDSTRHINGQFDDVK